MQCCGVDEAGRGPLAGPVFAAAVVLGVTGAGIEGIDDSKKLSEKRRILLNAAIKEHAFVWSIASASVEEIDRLNILQASLLAMFRAVQALPVNAYTQIVIDGIHIPQAMKAWAVDRPLEVIARPRADAEVREVGAASILAKTARDAYMLERHALYPDYGFAAHKGYGTALHLAALARYGPCPEHRRSFAPVAQHPLL